MISVIKMIRTCEQFPEEYEGTLSDGRLFYVRCRFGLGTIQVCPADKEWPIVNKGTNHEFLR